MFDRLKPSALASSKGGHGAMLRKAWERVSLLPGGRKLFSKALGSAAPYTGTIQPQVLEVGHGYAKVQMKDRRQVRNHLRSVHAIALMNLAEVASGLAFLFGLPDQARGILTGLEIDYVKKARGTLTAECICDPPTSNARAEHIIEVVTRDVEGDVVTRARAKWMVGPTR